MIPDNVSIYSISSSSPSPEDHPPHPPEDDPIMEENLVKAFDKFFQKVRYPRRFLRVDS